MAELLDNCRFTAGSMGTDDFADGSADPSFRNLEDAGAEDGKTYPYKAQNATGTEWEIGRGTALDTSGGWILERTSIQDSSNGGSKVNFGTAPKVIVTVGKAEIVSLVVGPPSSTNNNIAVFDGTTGKLIKDSGVPSVFTQAGVDAVARSWLSKMQDVVNIRDFGAVGDGVTDDAPAIQAAIDYVIQTLGCGRVTASATSSYYRIDTQIDILPNGTTNGDVIFDGGFATFRPGASIDAMFNIAADRVRFENCHLINLDGNATKGVNMVNPTGTARFLIVANNYISGFTHNIYNESGLTP